MACSKCNNYNGYQSGYSGKGDPLPCSICKGVGKVVLDSANGPVVTDCNHCQTTGSCTLG